MPTQKTGVIYDRRMQEHKSKKAHPEKPERISAIMVRLEKSLLLSHPRVEYIQGIDRSVSKEELMLAHPEQYVDYIANLWPKVSHRKDITILDTYFS